MNTRPYPTIESVGGLLQQLDKFFVAQACLFEYSAQSPFRYILVVNGYGNSQVFLGRVFQPGMAAALVMNKEFPFSACQGVEDLFAL